MAFDLMKAELMIGLNLGFNCLDFRSFLNTTKGSQLVDSEIQHLIHLTLQIAT